jgi:hypothetical protein
MSDKKSIPTFIDKRLQERLVSRGEVTAKALAEYLKALPDLAAEVDYVEYSGDETSGKELGESS